MAEIIGYIATQPQAGRNAAGVRYFAFRLAENHGKFGSPNRKTNWYKVRARIKEADAARLYVRQFVRIRGRLDIEAHMKRDFVEPLPVPDSWGKLERLLKAQKALAVDVVLLTTSVLPCELPEREANGDAEDYA